MSNTVNILSVETKDKEIPCFAVKAKMNQQRQNYLSLYFCNLQAVCKTELLPFSINVLVSLT